MSGDALCLARRDRLLRLIVTGPSRYPTSASGTANVPVPIPPAQAAHLPISELPRWLPMRRDVRRSRARDRRACGVFRPRDRYDLPVPGDIVRSFLRHFSRIATTALSSLESSTSAARVRVAQAIGRPG
jgi:hypothetical protein